MFTRKDYKDVQPLIETLKNKVSEDSYRLGFHLMPPTGWLNDPNGLCQFNGTHHIYFQYTPHKPTWGIKLWGHYTTQDWVTYQEEEPFLFADSKYDCDGVYSGSAFVENNQIYYFYTGNVKYTDQSYDYICNGREQNTLLLTSKDGYHHGEKKLLLTNSDYPSDMSLHVRDPKIYKKEGLYYMVLGARTKQERGCVLLYVSDNLSNWQYHMRIECDIPFGYMWECPDLFDLEGKTFLMCCPQGLKQKDFAYANVYQCGYFEIKLDLKAKTYQLSSFIELDRGFDLYALQSFEDEQGRRIVSAWMGLPDANYHSQDNVAHGWQHALSMPRELHVKANQLIQQPLKELQNLRYGELCIQFVNEGRLNVATMFECDIKFTSCIDMKMNVRDDIMFEYKEAVLSLYLGKSGCGRDVRRVQIKQLQRVQIFMDTSSLEIFVNDGQEVFTTRYFTKAITPLEMKGMFAAKGMYYELLPFQIKNKRHCEL